MPLALFYTTIYNTFLITEFVLLLCRNITNNRFVILVPWWETAYSQQDYTNRTQPISLRYVGLWPFSWASLFAPLVLSPWVCLLLLLITSLTIEVEEAQAAQSISFHLTFFWQELSFNCLALYEYLHFLLKKALYIHFMDLTSRPVMLVVGLIL